MVLIELRPFLWLFLLTDLPHASFFIIAVADILCVAFFPIADYFSVLLF